MALFDRAAPRRFTLVAAACAAMGCDPPPARTVDTLPLIAAPPPSVDRGQETCAPSGAPPLRLEVVHREERVGARTLDVSLLKTPIAELDARLSEYAASVRARFADLTQTCSDCDLSLECLPGSNTGDILSVHCYALTSWSYGAELHGFTYARGPTGFRPLRLRDLFRDPDPKKAPGYDGTRAFEALWERDDAYALVVLPKAPLRLALFPGTHRPPIDLDAARALLSCPLAAATGSATFGVPLPDLACTPPQGDARPLPVKPHRRRFGSFRKGHDVAWFSTGVEVIDRAVEAQALGALASWQKASFAGARCGAAGLQACTMRFGCAVSYNDGRVFSANCWRADDVGGAAHPAPAGDWFYNFVAKAGGWESLGSVRRIFLRPDEVRMKHDCFGRDYHIGPGVVLMDKGGETCSLPTADVEKELVCPLRFLQRPAE